MTCNRLQQFDLSHYHGYCNFLCTRSRQSKWADVESEGKKGETRKAGSAGGWTLRYDRSRVITVTFLYLLRHCPCRSALISAPDNWQRASASNSLTWTFYYFIFRLAHPTCHEKNPSDPSLSPIPSLKWTCVMSDKTDFPSKRQSQKRLPSVIVNLDVFV